MAALSSIQTERPSRVATADQDRDDLSDGSASAFGTDFGVPHQLGGVRIQRLLGQGGMGRVYLGHHPILDIDVAVKVLFHHGMDRTRFLAEARLAARIDHENIVRILHAGEERGNRFLVMEFVPGCTLKQLVNEKGRLTWRQAADYILQAARGLAAAHRQGIIHRDVKPSNLLLDPIGRVKVADLGLALAMRGGRNDAEAGSVVGTPAYMAPEQALDPDTIAPAADVYALGICLYYLIAGELPYPGLNFSNLQKTHRDSSLPDLRSRVPGLPSGILLLSQRMMAKEPSLRPADGAEVVTELERLLGLATASTSEIAGGLPRPPLSRRGWLVACAACLATASLGILGWTHAPMAPAKAGALAGPPPVPAAAPADAWQTPPRAVFLISDHLPATVLAEIDTACRGSGLPLVERERVETLVHEQDLMTGGRIDPATAGRIGRLVGGHIALFATATEDRIAIRTVVVETGEVVASRFVPPGEVAAAVTAGIASAGALLPLQGRVAAEGDRISLSCGSRHGLHPGDRISLRHSSDGPGFATATVAKVGPDRADLVVEPAGTAIGGALAARLAP